MQHTITDPEAVARKGNELLAEVLESLASAMATWPGSWSDDHRTAWVYGILSGAWNEDPREIFEKFPWWDEETRQRFVRYSHLVRHVVQRYGGGVTRPVHLQMQEAICEARGEKTYVISRMQARPDLVATILLDEPLGGIRMWMVTSHKTDCWHDFPCQWTDLVVGIGTYRRETGGSREAPDWQPRKWLVIQQNDLTTFSLPTIGKRVRAALAEKEEG